MKHYIAGRGCLFLWEKKVVPIVVGPEKPYWRGEDEKNRFQFCEEFGMCGGLGKHATLKIMLLYNYVHYSLISKYNTGWFFTSSVECEQQAKYSQLWCVKK